MAMSPLSSDAHKVLASENQSELNFREFIELGFKSFQFVVFIWTKLVQQKLQGAAKHWMWYYFSDHRAV